MRRSLVMTDDTARHPFRASLPAHVFRRDEPAGDGGAAAIQRPGPEVRQFLQAYVACLVGIGAFIA
ncbi:MAG: hypothetical protein B7Z08_13405 [Sphingomonadales bacterium 32-68-7]|nr:MAG: hypothetical protein B7Z08_13405 [Sphingomonadales bacterium 32-68-7]